MRNTSAAVLSPSNSGMFLEFLPLKAETSAVLFLSEFSKAASRSMRFSTNGLHAMSESIKSFTSVDEAWPTAAGCDCSTS